MEQSPSAIKKSNTDNKKRDITEEEKKQNPKTFAYTGTTVKAKKVQLRLQVPITIDCNLGETAPPYVIVVQGPPQVGKSLLIKSLVKHYTKHNIPDVLRGPLTIVSGNQRRLQFVECPNDINGMIDAAKFADLVLLLIDGSYGFEMETFEFLKVLQVHGFPRIMGVLTHLDKFKDVKKLIKTKQRLKHRFGVKLFYLSGLIHGKYVKREVHKIARFISVMKFHPLSWRTTHPYILVDRFEDVTPPDKVSTNKKCDRNVTVYGYLRGCNMRKGTKVHIAGIGDFNVAGLTELTDPCPLPSAAEKKGLRYKEKLFYAPTSGLGDPSKVGDEDESSPKGLDDDDDDDDEDDDEDIEEVVQFDNGRMRRRVVFPNENELDDQKLKTINEDEKVEDDSSDDIEEAFEMDESELDDDDFMAIDEYEEVEDFSKLDDNSDHEDGEKDEEEIDFMESADDDDEFFKPKDEPTRIDSEGYRIGTYLRLEINNVPSEMIEYFDPCRPILVGGIGLTKQKFGYMQMNFKRLRWHKKVLKNKDPIIVSIGWRRYQMLPIYAVEYRNGRHRLFKYVPEYRHCLAMFWGPLVPPKTGIIAVQNLSSNHSSFRITATAVVSHAAKIVLKIKRVGEPHKICNKSTLVKTMFTTDLAKIVKKVGNIDLCNEPKKLEGQPEEGIAQCTFENKKIMSDIAFSRVWTRVNVPCFYNPLTVALQPHGQPEPKELLKNINAQLRSGSTGEIVLIARDFGEEFTREKLVPYLTEFAYDQEDIIYARLAQLCGDLIDYVGGFEHLHVFLLLLEDLCGDIVEYVREEAVKSICKIGSFMTDSVLVASLIPFIKRLANNDLCFPGRISASEVFHVAYCRVSSNMKEELRPTYIKLCQDSTPAVMMSAFINLWKFAATLSLSHIKTEFMPIVEDLTNHDRDSIRLLAVDGCAAFCKLLEPQDRSAYILPLVVKLSEDTSSNVCCMVANHLHELYEPLIDIGTDILSTSLLPLIVKLSKDRYWRVQLAVTEYIPLLASKIGVGIHDEKLVAICMQSLQEKNCQIKEAGAYSLKRLAHEFGPNWAMEHIIPQVLEMANNQQYLDHMATLGVISLLAPIMGLELTATRLLPVVITLAKDRMANVRLNVASVLHSFISVIHPSVMEKTVRPCLIELVEDQHIGVSHFSKQTLEAIDRRLVSPI